jgi:protein-L-isoaspartate(D-aspartate) O-methyltransferase
MTGRLARLLAAAVLVSPMPDRAPAHARQVQADARTAARTRMVEEQIKARGIKDPAVLAAMARVPRHLFVPENVQPFAYEDRPLPIGRDQTISQPYIVAYMSEMLRVSKADTVLEIGTGSGYQAAVLSELAREVLSIEIVPELADRARRVLADNGYRNVQVRTGDGYRGWPERAPFQRIIVTAAPPQIPRALVDQLAAGGRMVVPVGTALQEIVILTKRADGTVSEERTIGVRFVPMVKPK